MFSSFTKLVTQTNFYKELKEYYDNNTEVKIALLDFDAYNNEKSDDVARFTSANLPIDDENSFMYSLNKFYIELAKNMMILGILGRIY